MYHPCKSLIVFVFTSLTILAQSVTPYAGTPVCLFPVNEDTFASFGEVLGGSDNGNAPGSQGTGSRRIKWDDLPEGGENGGRFPADLFNTIPTTRGLVLSGSTPFALPPVELAPDDPISSRIVFGNQHRVLPRLLGSPENVVHVFFYVPGTDVPAAVSGFGGFFTSDFPARVTIELFSGFERLNSSVTFFPANGLLCVASRPDRRATHARITTFGFSQGDDLPAPYVVVAHDFLYGEPIPITKSVFTLSELLATIELLSTKFDAACEGGKACRKVRKDVHKAQKRVAKIQEECDQVFTHACVRQLEKSAGFIGSFMNKLERQRTVEQLADQERQQLSDLGNVILKTIGDIIGART